MDAKIGNQPSSKVMSVEEITSLMKEGELGAMLDFTVTDKDGKIISQVTKKAESFVQQFLQLLYTAMQPIYASGSNPVNVKNTANVTKTPIRSIELFDTLAASGDTTYGIIVGTDSTAVTISDYAINTPIAHGTGSGQLQYGGVTFGAPSANTTISQMTITRNFANNSGNLVTVNEIALYCRAYDPNTGVFYAMIIRDVIAGGIAVAIGQTLTVNYRPQAAI
jgi:flagellar hook-associated protein FlgK